MTPPLVTVLLTSYNRPTRLVTAIDSVRKQTLQNWELIVLDDNSGPAVWDVILRARAEDDRVAFYVSNVKDTDRYLVPRYAVNINLGLQMAMGEFIAYLCDDDFYYPNHLTVCSAALRRHPTWDVVYGRQQLVERIALGGLQNKEQRRTSDAPNAKGELRDAFCKVDHAQVMHRRRLTDRLGGWPIKSDYDYVRMGDAFFWRKLHAAGCVFHALKPVTSAHVCHRDTITVNVRPRSEAEQRVFMERARSGNLSV